MNDSWWIIQCSVRVGRVSIRILCRGPRVLSHGAAGRLQTATQTQTETACKWAPTFGPTRGNERLLGRAFATSTMICRWIGSENERPPHRWLMEVCLRRHLWPILMKSTRHNWWCSAAYWWRSAGDRWAACRRRRGRTIHGKHLLLLRWPGIWWEIDGCTNDNLLWLAESSSVDFCDYLFILLLFICWTSQL